MISSFTDALHSRFSSSEPMVPSAGATRVMPRGSRESPYSAVSRIRREINVCAMLDVSGSMPSEAVRYMLGSGSKLIMRILKQYMGLDYHYNIRIATFGTTVTEVLPFTPLEDALECELPHVEPFGVTCTEDAMRDAIQAVKEQKAKQDAAHTPRGSSIIIVITDGHPTDSFGNIVPLDPALAEEIA